MSSSCWVINAEQWTGSFFGVEAERYFEISIWETFWICWFFDVSFSHDEAFGRETIIRRFWFGTESKDSVVFLGIDDFGFAFVERIWISSIEIEWSSFIFFFFILRTEACLNDSWKRISEDSI